MQRLRAAFRLIYLVALISGPVRAATPDEVDPNLPQHELVCAGGLVSKRQLVTVLLVNTKNYDAILAVSRGPDLWRTLFTDDNFCKAPQGCSSQPSSDACKAAVKCTLAKASAVYAAVSFFTAVNAETKRANASYSESSRLYSKSSGNVGDQVSLYFANPSDKADPIACTDKKVRTAQPGFDATKDPIASNIRLRGLSDDLYIDRALPAFKGTTPATTTYTNESLGVHTSTLRASGSVGYAFDSIPQTQIVPYFSFNQANTWTAGKPASLDLNDYVAGGVLFESYFDHDGVSHVFTFKPQYLFNTNTEARLGSVRAIYAPWMDIPFNVNTFRQLDFLPGSPWAQFIFNLRGDLGTYSDRGNTPAAVALNQDFVRTGTQVGITLTTDGVPNVPSLTLIMMETYLRGFSGFYKSMDLFQTSLTYNIVSNYVGLTASYKKGRDEDTAIASQVWTIGLSARF